MKISFISLWALLLTLTHSFAQDTTPPVARAKSSVVLDLGPDGTATLTPEMVNDGSSDNVTVQENLRFSLSKTSFDCADMEKAEWQSVGGDGISAGSTDFLSLAISPEGTPHLAYKDAINEHKATVLQWNGTSWGALGGAGISAAAANFQSLVIARNGTPYIAYQDEGNGNKTTVLKWNGTSWEALGGAGISSGSSSYQSIAISPTGTPYIAYRDGTNNGTTVLKWNANGWEALGGAGISAGTASYQSLAISPDGAAYVAFQDYTMGQKTTVLKWTGSSWIALGGEGVSAAKAYDQSMAVSPDGTPYVAYRDEGNGNNTTVLRWNGTSWEALGGAGIPSGAAYDQSLAISPDGSLYVAFRESGSLPKTTVLQWTGTSWQRLGNNGISSGAFFDQNLAISPDGTPYVAHKFNVNNVYKASVHKFFKGNRVTLTVEDEAGNKAVAGSLIAIKENVFPMAIAKDVTIGISAGCGSSVTTDMVNNGSTDNCTPAEKLLLSLEGKTYFTAEDIGPHTVSLKVVDASGNIGIATATVKVVEIIPPTVKIKPEITVELNEEGVVILDPKEIDDGSIDDVTSHADLKMSLKKSNFDCSDMQVKEWRKLGGPDNNLNNYAGFIFAISPDGTPYIAGRDINNGNKTTVLQWTGSKWEPLGQPDIYTGEAIPQSLAISPDGKPYLAFQDISKGRKTTVIMWNGYIWEVLGGAGISGGEVYHQSLVISPDGTPFMAYCDLANGEKTTVLKYTCNSWEALGGGGISAASARYQSLAVSPDGIPYVAYKDNSIGGKTTVLKWTGSSWLALGGEGISRESHQQQIAISPNGTPYVLFADGFIDGGRATVLKWTGSNWESLGDLGLSTGEVRTPNLALSPEGIPYVAYHDVSLGGRTSVLKWNGSSWETFEKKGFSAGESWYQRLILSPDGTPYVAYLDYTNGRRTTVQQFYQGNRLVLSVEDEAGNKAVGGSLLYIRENIPPMAVAKDLTIKAKGSAEVIVKPSLVNNGSFDNCTPVGDLILSLEGKTSFNSNDLGTHTISLKVEDANGNIGTANATVRVVDGVPPTVKIKKEVAVERNEGGTPLLRPEQVNDGSYDNFSPLQNLKLTVEQTPLDCAYTEVEEWQPIEVPNAPHGNIEVAPDGTLYLAYREEADNGKITVLKKDGNSWVNLDGEPGSKNISVSPDGTLYEIYSDEAKQGKVVVAKWTGSSWEILGREGISEGVVWYSRLAFSPDGTPFVVYQDKISGKAIVLRWNGGSWDSLGVVGVFANRALFISLEVPANNIPVVAYNSWENGEYFIHVLKWTGTRWESLKGEGGEISREEGYSLSLSPGGTPYLAFSNPDIRDKFYVRKWNGTNWESLGEIAVPFTPYFVSMKISPEGVPHLTYSIDAADHKPVVLKYTGSDWEALGGGSISARSAWHINLDILPDGTPYVFYTDYDEENLPKLMVQKFHQSNRIRLTVEDEAGNKSIAGTLVKVRDNLPPQLIANEVLDLGPGGNLLIIKETLEFSTNCSPASETLYTITTPPAFGRLELVNTAGTAITSFSQHNINSNELRYVLTDDTQPSDQFAFTVSDGNGNITDEQLFFIGEKAVMGLLDDKHQKLPIIVHPNPTNGRITISLEGNYLGGEVLLSLSDLSGRILLLHEGSLEQCQEKVGDFLGGAKSGVFLLQLKVRDNLKTVKVVRK